MLKFMVRSTIYYLKQKGWTNTQIAEFNGHHRHTIARVLCEPIDRTPLLCGSPCLVVPVDYADYSTRSCSWRVKIKRELAGARMGQVDGITPASISAGTNMPLAQAPKPLYSNPTKSLLHFCYHHLRIAY
jgi:hypothetical protein